MLFRSSKYIWKYVENLEYPINSEADDFSIVFQDKNHGLFTSNRNGKVSKDDIYSFTLNNENEIISDYNNENDSIFQTLTNVFLNNEELSCPGNSMINSMQIFPNPNNGEFSVKTVLSLMGKYQLRIFNSSGQIIYTKEINITANEQITNIILPYVSKGPYYIQLLKNSKIELCDKLLIE